MKIENDDITALIGTIIIHVIALILLYMGVIRTLAPLGDGGTPVAFGDYTAVAGIYQPPPSTTVAQPRPTQPQPSQQQSQPRQRQNQTRTPARTTARPAAQPSGETVITQTREETVSVPENTANTNTAAANANAQREREENERRQREEEEIKQQEEKDKLASNAFSGNNTQADNQGGATSGTSNPGNPFGDRNTRTTEGAKGINPSVNLGGRPVGDEGIQRPVYTESEEGRIVVYITVDPKGNVIKAEAGRGSTGTAGGNISMRKKAEDAALRTKFKSISGTNDQTGTITYNYFNN